VRKKKVKIGHTKDAEKLDLKNLRVECYETANRSLEDCETCLQKIRSELSRSKSEVDIAYQVELLDCLATCTFDLKQYDEAKTYLKRLIQSAQSGIEVKDLNKIYNNLGRIELMQSDLKSAEDSFQKALELCSQQGEMEIAGGMCLNLSNVYSHWGQPDKCLEYLQKALEIFTALNNSNRIYLTKSSLANYYLKRGNLSLAMDYKQECVIYFTEIEDKAQLAREMSTLAIIYYRQDNLEKAIDYALNSLKLKEHLNDTTGIANIWINLGVFYNEFGDTDSALKYYLQALSEFEKIGDINNISICLNNISNCYKQKKDDKKALEFLFKSAEFKQNTGEIQEISLIYQNIGGIYEEVIQDYEKADEYYNLALKFAKQCKEDFILNSTKLKKAVTLANLKKKEEALDLLNTTKKNIYRQKWEKLYAEVHKAESTVYELLSRYKEAYSSMLKYTNLIEERYTADAQTRIAEMRAKYEADKKEKEAEIYRLKNIELQEKKHQLEEQKNKLQETLDKLHQSEIRYDFVSEELSRSMGTTLIGCSSTIRSITQMIAMVAKSEKTPVLISGETGTGKEIVARNIHLCSKRGQQHFYAVNCSAVPENLFESQFFGHEKDSFTGAAATKVGWFEIANNSTLFLDEVGSLSYDQQAKLLRALEERCIVRVGSHREIPIDLRLISATNINLLHKVDQDEFRRDLYHRLAVFVINIPPLREHREDIPQLLKHFVGLATVALNKKINKVDKDVISYLLNYDFPGNVRELRNMVERAVLVTESSTLHREHFRVPCENSDVINQEGIVHLSQLERNMIVKALQASSYNRVQAAKLLGVERKVVERKILKYKITIPNK